MELEAGGPPRLLSLFGRQVNRGSLILDLEGKAVPGIQTETATWNEAGDRLELYIAASLIAREMDIVAELRLSYAGQTSRNRYNGELETLYDSSRPVPLAIVVRSHPGRSLAEDVQHFSQATLRGEYSQPAVGYSRISPPERWKERFSQLLESALHGARVRPGAALRETLESLMAVAPLGPAPPGANWGEVLSAYFLCLKDCPPPEFAERVHRVVGQLAPDQLRQLVFKARQLATPEQERALDARE